jgi:hypothetical protein
MRQGLWACEPRVVGNLWDWGDTERTHAERVRDQEIRVDTLHFGTGSPHSVFLVGARTHLLPLFRTSGSARWFLRVVCMEMWSVR